MAKKRKFKWWYIAVAAVILYVLSQAGIMNNLFAVTEITCSATDPCPTANCVGSFTLAEKDMTEDCDTLNSTDKYACKLNDFWYDFQGELKDIECVDTTCNGGDCWVLDEDGVKTGWHKSITETGASTGVCETSPYCLIRTDDITNWIKNNPLAWVQNNSLLALGILAMIVALIYLLYIPDK